MNKFSKIDKNIFDEIILEKLIESSVINVCAL